MKDYLEKFKSGNTRPNRLKYRYLIRLIERNIKGIGATFSVKRLKFARKFEPLSLNG